MPRRFASLVVLFCVCSTLAVALAQPALAQVCTLPPAGIVSWWPGDGNAHDIAGSNDGTLVNGVTFAQGEVGQAFAFNSTNFVQSNTADLPINSDDRTLELWVNVNSFVTPEAFFAGYGSFGFNNQTYHLGTSGNQLFFSQWGDAIFGPTLDPGTWHHLAATSAGGLVTLYLDGLAVGSKNMVLQTPANSFFFMGSPGGDPYRTLNGLTDEVTVYKRALSDAEISLIYSAGSAGKCKLPLLVSSLTTLITSLNLPAPLKNLLLFYVQQIPTVINSLTPAQKENAVQDLNTLIARVKWAISTNHIPTSFGNELVKLANEAIVVLAVLEEPEHDSE